MPAPTASSSLGYGNLLRIRSLSREGKLLEIKQIKQKLETLRVAATMPAATKMQNREYLDFLATVDTANPGETQHFMNATQCHHYDNLPDLIPIGSHEGVQYFIHSSDLEIPQDWSAISGQKHDPERFAGVSKALNQDSKELFYPGMSQFSAKQYATDILEDLKYGFGLGRLHHKMPNDSEAEDTGFYVICNAVDKSIWIAFDFGPYGETGVDTVEPEYGDPYGQLPGDEQMIGVQRLFGGDWRSQHPYSLDRGDPFTGGAGRPMATRLFAKPVHFGEVVEAIKEYRESQAPESGSTAKLQIGESLSGFDSMEPRND